MRWLRIEWKNGVRIYIFGRRIHHLEAGLILVILGWTLILHDWILERKKLDEYDSRRGFSPSEKPASEKA